MKNGKNTLLVLILLASFTMISCQSEKKKNDKKAPEIHETPAKNVPAEKADTAKNDWIDTADAANLSSTWVDEEDKGDLSNTWAEDAFAKELGTSSQSNSWVDESGEKIYKKTEVPPEFVGGKEALFKYINQNIQYPEDVKRGNVYIAFVITKDGDIRDARIVKGINENCDKEALRLINNMPRWDPGMEKGQIVSSVYGLPIIFRP